MIFSISLFLVHHNETLISSVSEVPGRNHFFGKKKKEEKLPTFSLQSNTFFYEVMGSQAGQDNWNNIIRSLREEQGHIIRLNPTEWKCMGGKVLTLPLARLIQFPALTPCHRYSSRAVFLRPTNFNILHLRCNIYHPTWEWTDTAVVRWKGRDRMKFKVREENGQVHPWVSNSLDPCTINTQSNICSNTDKPTQYEHYITSNSI